VRRAEIPRIREALALRPELAAAGTAAVNGVRELLRKGAGEEELLARLVALVREAGGEAPAPAELVAVARELLKIGVRPRGTGWRRCRAGPDVCTVCEKEAPFCWGCDCGLRLCQDCLEDLRWGITCNNITWECPDCGAIRSF
jgi:hypothetical protein